MNPDHILADLRDLAANATRSARSAQECHDAQCDGHRHRAEAMAARFTELDASLSFGGIVPTAWNSPHIPAQRTKR